MRRLGGLAAKLLLLTVGGIVLLAGLFAAQLVSALVRVRNEALGNAAAGLTAQSRTQLPLLHEEIAGRIQERLGGIADDNRSLAQSILDSRSRGLVNPGVAAVPLTALPSGALADLRPDRITSVYAPPGADQAALSAELLDTALLDRLMPQHLLAKHQIILASAYIGASGLLRLYPAVDVARYPVEREQALLGQVAAGGTEPTWLAPFAPPAFISTVDPQITAVVQPVYAGTTLRGLVVSYVSLGSLTADLIGIQPTLNSAIFLIGGQRQVIASSERFVPVLLGALSGAGTVRTITQTLSPDLDRIVAAMVAGEQGIQQLTLREQQYLLTYQPISGTDWSLGMAVPIDELTASASTVAEGIRATSQAVLWNTLLSTAGVGLLALLGGFYFTRRLTRPLGTLAASAHALAAGQATAAIPVRSHDELGELATAFNDMSRAVQDSQAALQTANWALEATVQARTGELEQTIAELQRALATQSELDRQLNTISTPVIPVSDGVVLMPLIGALDAARTQQAVLNLLEYVERSQAHQAIIDITGLPAITNDSAAALVRAAHALRLMGARTILTGIRPAVAELLLTLDTRLSDIEPVASLQDALTLALTRPRTARDTTHV